MFNPKSEPKVTMTVRVYDKDGNLKQEEIVDQPMTNETVGKFSAALKRLTGK